MEIKSIIILSLIAVINSQYDESTFKVDHITLLSSDPFGDELQSMKNVSFNCYAKFNCSKFSCEHQFPPIKWLIPRELRESELLFGKYSTRVEFLKQSNDWFDNNKSIMIKSEMLITDIGAVHKGSYCCFHDYINANAQFTLNVRVQNTGEKCDFNDQCKSGSCYENQCKCDENNQVYIAHQNQCFPVSQWNTSCKYDEQCSHSNLNYSAKCIHNLCQCEKGFVPLTIPMRGKICAKIAELNESCTQSVQCSQSDSHSYCSSKMKCKCLDGYHLISKEANKKCEPYKKCDSSLLGFNYNLTQSSCDINEFCRYNVCLCLPNFVRSDGGECILSQNDNSTTEASNHTTIDATTSPTTVKFVKCLDPSSHIGEKIKGESGVDGVGLIQHFCAELKSKSPYTEWLRGENIVEKCEKIPHLTPIATFLSIGRTYGGDAAVFDSCDNQTVVRVFYQNNSQPIESKVLPLKGDPVNNANYYFTIIPK